MQNKFGLNTFVAELKRHAERSQSAYTNNNIKSESNALQIKIKCLKKDKTTTKITW